MAGIKPNNFPLRATLDGTEEIYTQTNDTSEKFTLDQVKEYVSEWSEQIVNITVEQLLNIATTPITLFNTLSLTSSQFFELNRIVVEVNISSGYTLSKSLQIKFGGAIYETLPDSMLTGTKRAFNVMYSKNFKYNQGDGLQLTADASPTGGNGTMRIKIYYKISTVI